MADLFRLSDEQWAVMAPFMPTDQPRPERKDDRQIVSGILYVLTSGCRWRHALQKTGRAPPATTGSTGGLAAASGKPCSPRWRRPDGPATRPLSIAPMCVLTARPTATRGAKAQAIGRSRGKIDTLTDVLGHPGVLLLTSGNAGDATTARAVLAEAPGRIWRLAADKGYDAEWLRTDLRDQGITPVISGKRGLKRRIRRDKRRYHERWRIEATFNQSTDFRLYATRYNKLAYKYALAVALAYWCRSSPDP